MFGGPDSCRKQYGTLKDNHLPSIRDYMTHATNGTSAPCTLGAWLSEQQRHAIQCARVLSVAGFCVTRPTLPGDEARRWGRV